VLLVDWPGPTLFDGNGTARVYLDDGVSDDQERELSAIFQGQRGGTMEILGGLVSKWLPVEKTSISVSRDGDVVTAKVGSVGEVASTAFTGRSGKRLHPERRRLRWRFRHGGSGTRPQSRHEVVGFGDATRVRGEVGRTGHGHDERRLAGLHPLDFLSAE
jgi:hypothetical protein